MTVLGVVVVTLRSSRGWSCWSVTKKNTPVDPRIRLAISQWPANAPRGTVTSFCAEHGISRKTFYALLKRAREESPAAVLEPRSRRPHSSPSKLEDEVRQDALRTRASLEQSGLDAGPISVFDKMHSNNLEAPSIASLARIFRDEGVARREPKKRPRSSYRRFVYPAPNACWQLDATEYVLAGGRKCAIFQLQDDHSRVAVATYVDRAETSAGAIAVVRKGIAARGTPQRLLTDNGSALNPSRRGLRGELVTFVTGLGIEAITGKPGKPTTQGKNERFHQTLFRWLDKQPLARTIVELQALVDEFDIIYNTERPHQGLPGRVTPQQAWDLTPLAEPLRPAAPPDAVEVPGVDLAPAAQSKSLGTAVRKVQPNGVIRARGTTYNVSKHRAGQIVHIAWDETTMVVADDDGEIILERDRPPKGVRYSGNSRPPYGDRKP